MVASAHVAAQRLIDSKEVSTAPAGGDRISREYLLHLNPSPQKRKAYPTPCPAVPALPRLLIGHFHYSYLNRALLPGLAHCFMSITDLTQSFCFIHLVHCDTLFWFAYTGVISSNYASLFGCKIRRVANLVREEKGTRARWNTSRLHSIC